MIQSSVLSRLVKEFWIELWLDLLIVLPSAGIKFLTYIGIESENRAVERRVKVGH